MKIKLLLILVCLLLLIPSTAFANAGPAYYEKYPGINMVPIYSNHIRVLEERLEFDISENPGKFPTVQAEVSVHYFFENTGEEEEIVLLAFPYDSTYSSAKSNINILFDGAPVAYSVYGSMIDYISIDHPYFHIDYDMLSFEEILAYLVNEVREEDLVDGESGQTKVILFEITFLPSAKHELLVTYTMVPSMEREETNIFPYFIEIPWHPDFIYYLEPAKYWQEFNDLTISIRTPKNFPLGFVNLPGIVEVEPGYHVGNYDALPEKNLQFSLVDSNSMNKMNRGIFIRRAVLFIFLLLLLLTIIFIVRMIYRAISKKS